MKGRGGFGRGGGVDAWGSAMGMGGTGERCQRKGRRAKGGSGGKGTRMGVAAVPRTGARRGREQGGQGKGSQGTGGGGGGGGRRVPAATKRDGLSLKINTSVYVTGLPEDTTVDEVVEVFSKCGVIKEVRQARTDRAGASFLGSCVLLLDRSKKESGSSLVHCGLPTAHCRLWPANGSLQKGLRNTVFFYLFF